jgi:hypothetical protein
MLCGGGNAGLPCRLMAAGGVKGACCMKAGGSKGCGTGCCCRGGGGEGVCGGACEEGGGTFARRHLPLTL